MHYGDRILKFLRFQVMTQHRLFSFEYFSEGASDLTHTHNQSFSLFQADSSLPLFHRLCCKRFFAEPHCHRIVGLSPLDTRRSVLDEKF